MKNLFFSIVLMGMTLSGCCGTSSSTFASDPATKPADYEMTAAQLYRAYQANELSADNTYKNKIILVSGRVETVARDAQGKVYVSLSGGLLTFGSVLCYFPSSREEETAALTTLQRVSIKGRCEGLSEGDVILVGCTL